MRDFLMFHKGRDGVHRSRSYSVLISLRRRQKSQNAIRGRIGELFSVKVYNSNFAPHHSTISTTSKKAAFCGFALVALHPCFMAMDLDLGNSPILHAY
ncbi:hypothetical protein K449DRAFT_143254 [Hypoxylon sp. EC38]|nr:hypothetical protein K449DRAFT_143254 [Hypoxylon sp. EC38]